MGTAPVLLTLAVIPLAESGKRSRSVGARSRAILADFRCPADVNAAAGTRGAGGVRVPRCALRLDGEAHRRSAPVMECHLATLGGHSISCSFSPLPDSNA